MRAVTFVDRITLKIEGSMAQCGVYLGDVDGDGGHELVFGTTDGNLYIHKGSSGQPWHKSGGLGFITAVAVGDLLNIGRNVLVAASGCGWLYIFDMSKYGDEVDIEPTYRQRVPANIRDLIISDINSDGNHELVVSLTDRVVRMYRWTLLDTPTAGDKCRDCGEGREDCSLSSSDISAASFDPAHRNTHEGRFICINKWEFASQIGTISFNMDSEGNPAILIAQPGGAFMRLRVKKKKETPGENWGYGEERPAKEEANNMFADESGESGLIVGAGGGLMGGEGGLVDKEGSLVDEGFLSKMSVEYEPLCIKRRANPNVSAEVLGGFNSGQAGQGTRFAIVTLDGSVLLVDDDGTKKPVDSIMWNLQVDHQLMCLSMVDVTGDGLEEVVCCSWDGQTYIISQDKQAVRFQFEESVSTFTAGNFTLSPGNTQPVLVYVTFNNTIQIYHNLCLGRDLTLSSLIHYPPMNQEAGASLLKLGCEKGNLAGLQQIYSYCLYGLPDND